MGNGIQDSRFKIQEGTEHDEAQGALVVDADTVIASRMIREALARAQELVYANAKLRAQNMILAHEKAVLLIEKHRLERTIELLKMQRPN